MTLKGRQKNYLSDGGKTPTGSRPRLKVPGEGGQGRQGEQTIDRGGKRIKKSGGYVEVYITNYCLLRNQN